MKKLSIVLIAITLSACAQETTTVTRECTDNQAAIDGAVKIIGILQGNAVWGGC